MNNIYSDRLKLKDGSTAIIVGGGPAGSTCAIKLMQLSKMLGISLKVLIFEEKDFLDNQNYCAGVLSPPLMEILFGHLNIEIPPSILNRKIFGYRLHVGEKGILLVGEDRKGPTYTIHRGDLDKYLIDCARSVGVKIIPERVNNIEFIGRENCDEVRVYTDSCQYKGDVIVGAFGSDEESMDTFEKATHRTGPYKRPPKFLNTIITRLPAEQGFIEKKLGNIIYVFLTPKNIPNIEFVAITPKKDHVFINIAGEKVLNEDMDAFFEFMPVKNYIPSVQRRNLDYKYARFPTSPAKNPYGHRYVTVGDATGWLRPMKGKGINTAIMTGIQAATTMMQYGLSKEAFSMYASACKELLDDYYYGMFVRFICNKFSTKIIEPFLEIAKVDPYLYEILYLSVSGHDTFKNIMKSLFNLKNMKRRVLFSTKGRGKKIMKNIIIRPLTVRDIDAIMEIDEKITGKPHASFWESKVASYLEREPGACLAAVIDDKLVGFILGDIRGWEYAIPLSGWVEIIGVDRDYQGKGIGRELIKALLEYFRQNNIEFVQAMINWNDGDIIDYLRSMGFERGEYINLVKKLK